MGLGGNLLWTAVFRELSRERGCKVCVCYMPKISDLLAGRLYDGSRSAEHAPVFKNNPYVCFNKVRSRSRVPSWLDEIFDQLLFLLRLRVVFERIVLRRSLSEGRPWIPAHLDMSLHSYVATEEPERFVWQKGGHIIDIVSRSFGIDPSEHRCELYFSDEEMRQVEEVKREIGSQSFIVIEPGTNEEYFGGLRAWRFERWQSIVVRCAEMLPDVKIVQIGIQGSRVLEGVISMCGKMTFRVAALLLKSSRLFMGTEGGLMHAANAVGAPTLLVYSGVNSPQFSAYPDSQRIVHHPVSCSNCGCRFRCPVGHECMEALSVEAVWGEVQKCLRNDSRLTGVVAV